MKRAHEIAVFELSEKATLFRVDHVPVLIDELIRVSGEPIDPPDYIDHLVGQILT